MAASKFETDSLVTGLAILSAVADSDINAADFNPFVLPGDTADEDEDDDRFEAMTGRLRAFARFHGKDWDRATNG